MNEGRNIITVKRMYKPGEETGKGNSYSIGDYNNIALPKFKEKLKKGVRCELFFGVNERKYKEEISSHLRSIRQQNTFGKIIAVRNDSIDIEIDDTLLLSKILDFYTDIKIMPKAYLRYEGERSIFRKGVSSITDIIGFDICFSNIPGIKNKIKFHTYETMKNDPVGALNNLKELVGLYKSKYTIL